MKETRYVCDKCGEEIKDVVYSLKCYAEDISPGALGGVSTEVAAQNMKQNFSGTGTRHLCRVCKDKLTDGVFVV